MGQDPATPTPATLVLATSTLFYNGNPTIPRPVWLLPRPPTAIQDHLHGYQPAEAPDLLCSGLCELGVGQWRGATRRRCIRYTAHHIAQQDMRQQVLEEERTVAFVKAPDLWSLVVQATPPVTHTRQGIAPPRRNADLLWQLHQGCGVNTEVRSQRERTLHLRSIRQPQGSP